VYVYELRERTWTLLSTAFTRIALFPEGPAQEKAGKRRREANRVTVSTPAILFILFIFMGFTLPQSFID